MNASAAPHARCRRRVRRAVIGGRRIACCCETPRGGGKGWLRMDGGERSGSQPPHRRGDSSGRPADHRRRSHSAPASSPHARRALVSLQRVSRTGWRRGGLSRQSSDVRRVTAILADGVPDDTRSSRRHASSDLEGGCSVRGPAARGCGRCHLRIQHVAPGTTHRSFEPAACSAARRRYGCCARVQARLRLHPTARRTP